jgi:hypothetical protein
VTPCAQGRCATRLRYAPTVWKELLFHYSECWFVPFPEQLSANVAQHTERLRI